MRIGCCPRYVIINTRYTERIDYEELKTEIKNIGIDEVYQEAPDALLQLLGNKADHINWDHSVIFYVGAGPLSCMYDCLDVLGDLRYCYGIKYTSIISMEFFGINAVYMTIDTESG